jgi:hypothetical protein
MKKYFSFERIMLILILIVLFFIPRIAKQQTFSYSYYYVLDTERDKVVGEFNSSTPIQKGHIIFLGDDVYGVEYIKCFLKKDKDKNILYSEDTHTHVLHVKFIGKSRVKKID